MKCEAIKATQTRHHLLLQSVYLLAGVGTSGMDYWNGTLEWTTYFPFLDKFLCYSLTFS